MDTCRDGDNGGDTDGTANTDRLCEQCEYPSEYHLRMDSIHRCDGLRHLSLNLCGGTDGEHNTDSFCGDSDDIYPDGAVVLYAI